MRRPGNKFSGEVEEYMREIGWDRYRGWIAVYATEKGEIEVYRSALGDPPLEIPKENLQAYLVLFRRWSKNRVLTLDGYDEYALIGYPDIRLGKMLSDERFHGPVWDVIHAEAREWAQHGD